MIHRPSACVIVPCHRHAGVLPEAIESVLVQERADWECVIVDDGSPDDTAAVARALAERDPQRRIRLVQREHGGVAAARNSGVRASTAPLLVPLDADDRLHPRYLAAVLARFDERSEVDLVFTDMRAFGARDEVDALGEFEPAGLLRENALPVTSAFRRALWERAGGYDDRLRDGYEDWSFWIACVEAGAIVSHVAEPLFHYRASDAGLLPRAQEGDAWLKARIIVGHSASFSPLQREWALRILDLAESQQPSPILDGLSFAPPCRLPRDGEALADLGALAYEEGDDARAIERWLAALRGPDLSSQQRTALHGLAVKLRLDGGLRARAEQEP